MRVRKVDALHLHGAASFVKGGEGRETRNVNESGTVHERTSDATSIPRMGTVKNLLTNPKSGGKPWA